jgi:hypothetical protein
MGPILGEPLVADMGTPLLWAGLLHLWVGNLLLGLLEGVLLALVFPVKILRAILLLIIANYFSAWVGSVAHRMAGPLYGQVHPQDLLKVVVAATAGTFLLSMIFEWPFVFFSFSGDRRLGRTFLATLLVQCFSYLLLIPWYLLPSNVAMLTDTALRDPASFVQCPDALVYFQSAEGQAMVMPLGGGNPERAEPPAAVAALLMQSSSDDFDLRPEADRQWFLGRGGSEMSGLRVRNDETGHVALFEMKTPFFSLAVGWVNVLPGDQAVFSLGDWICVIDRRTLLLGVLTRGKHPVVTLPQPR